MVEHLWSLTLVVEHSLSFLSLAFTLSLSYTLKSQEFKTKISHAHSLILSHTLTITCTCCYDEIKGTQDLKIYSHADSLSVCLSGFGLLRLCANC